MTSAVSCLLIWLTTNPARTAAQAQPGTAPDLSRGPHIPSHSLQVYALVTSLSLVFFLLRCPTQVQRCLCPFHSAGPRWTQDQPQPGTTPGSLWCSYYTASLKGNHQTKCEDANCLPPHVDRDQADPTGIFQKGYSSLSHSIPVTQHSGLAGARANTLGSLLKL